LICGGLGPTQDDLTRDAIAELMGVPLVRQMELAEHIATMFRSRLRDMPQNNLRQADIPDGGEALPNPIGTAPGLRCPVGDGKFVYAHRPDLEANWISLDDVAKCMIASLDRPDMEGAWLNIGGPQRLKPTDIAAALSDAIGRPVRYEAVSPRKFGELLTGAFGDDMDATERAATEDYIDAFYQYLVRGAILLAAVLLDQLKNRGARD